MKCWDCRVKGEVENEKATAFLKDIVAVYKKHGLSLVHEDHNGSFEIEDYKEDNVFWVMSADISANCKSI
jgi:hypothetical protein